MTTTPPSGPGADVSVRVAWADDAAAIARVQTAAWADRLEGLLPPEALPSSDQLAEAWHGTLRRPPDARHRVLVALVRNTVVGFVLTGPTSDPDGDPVADGEVAELTVAPDAVRTGHGSRLLQAAADTLVADGFSRARLWVLATDDVLRAFLVEAGWGPDGASRELEDERGERVKQVRLHTALS